MFYKEIVCLSISTKMGGSCVAGKDIKNNEWIRPISTRDYEQIESQDMKYENNNLPELLDIIKIPLKERRPSKFQPENILIDDEYCWEFIGKYPVNELDNLCDTPEVIFANEGAMKDRLSPEFIDSNKCDTSLILIKPEWIKIKRDDVPTERGTKRKVRAVFSYNSMTYDLGITDPKCKNEYLTKDSGYYEIHYNNIYLCISLGEPCPYDSHYYKLVASVIAVD